MFNTFLTNRKLTTVVAKYISVVGDIEKVKASNTLPEIKESQVSLLECDLKDLATAYDLLLCKIPLEDRGVAVLKHPIVPTFSREVLTIPATEQSLQPPYSSTHYISPYELVEYEILRNKAYKLSRDAVGTLGNLLREVQGIKLMMLSTVVVDKYIKPLMQEYTHEGVLRYLGHTADWLHLYKCLKAANSKYYKFSNEKVFSEIERFIYVYRSPQGVVFANTDSYGRKD